MIANSYPQLSWVAPQPPPTAQNAPDAVGLAAPSPDQQQLNAISLDVVRQSVDKLATGIAASQERLTRSLDRIAASQEQITRSVDKIAANQEQITHSVDRIAASDAIAGAAVGGPTSTPLMLPWEAPAFVAVRRVLQFLLEVGPRHCRFS